MKKDGAPRQASLHRATKETDIRVEWTLDGTGQAKVDTSIRFFDHMLELLARHGFFDLTVQAKGDIDIDEHHTVEDVGIVMGKALHQALGEKAGIKRFGWASVPLDETLAQVTVDLSGRPFLRPHYIVSPKKQTFAWNGPWTVRVRQRSTPPFDFLTIC